MNVLRNARGKVFGWVVIFCMAFASHAGAAASSPFVRIVGFAAVPVSGCVLPNAEFVVSASGDATTSDTFSIHANGQLVYQWEGETMAWAVSANPSTYSITGNPTALAQNTVLTATITTYEQSNPVGPIYTSGAPVYRAQASWNCTTGEQVGAIANADTRRLPIDTMNRSWRVILVGFTLTLALIGLRRLPRRPA